MFETTQQQQQKQNQQNSPGPWKVFPCHLGDIRKAPGKRVSQKSTARIGEKTQYLERIEWE